jgi:hypothetical protein
MKTAWIALSSFLILAGAWFATMEFILRHPGFIPRALVAALIVLHGALSLLYIRVQTANPLTAQPIFALRLTIILGALCALPFGFFAAITTLRSTHFEGYLLLLALGLIGQATLTLALTHTPLRLRHA